MEKLDLYGWIALCITLVGGINWGLIGLMRIDIFAAIFGTGFIGRIFLIVVGAAAGYLCYLIYLDKFKKPSTPTA